MTEAIKPHDADIHPSGYHPIATIKGGTVATCNGTAYWLDDDGTQTALSRLPKKRLVEMILDEARFLAQVREWLAAACPGRDWDKGTMPTGRNGDALPN